MSLDPPVSFAFKLQSTIFPSQCISFMVNHFYFFLMYVSCNLFANFLFAWRKKNERNAKRTVSKASFHWKVELSYAVYDLFTISASVLLRLFYQYLLFIYFSALFFRRFIFDLSTWKCVCTEHKRLPIAVQHMTEAHSGTIYRLNTRMHSK